MDACPLPTSESAAPALPNDVQQQFIPPLISGLAPSVVIEYCDRCRWLHRASWVSTELLLTFPPPALRGITLVPLVAADTAGRFRVWVFANASEGGEGSSSEELQRGEGLPMEEQGRKTAVMKMVWDRKSEGGFPELKVLKQRIRDCIDPGKSLGHSDKSHTQQTS